MPALTINFLVFILISLGLSYILVLPSLNLHLANSSLIRLRTDIKKIIEKNRTNPKDIEKKIPTLNNSLYEILEIDSYTSDAYRVFELKYRYKKIFGKDFQNFSPQKIKFIINNA